VFLKAYAVFRFVFLYALPVIVFVFCYWRILMVIRYQSKVTSGSRAGRLTRIHVVEAVTASTNVEGTTSCNVKTGQAKNAEHGNR